MKLVFPLYFGALLIKVGEKKLLVHPVDVDSTWYKLRLKMTFHRGSRRFGTIKLF